MHLLCANGYILKRERGGGPPVLRAPLRPPPSPLPAPFPRTPSLSSARLHELVDRQTPRDARPHAQMARRRKQPRTLEEITNRALRKSAVLGTFTHTTALADMVEAATDGHLTVIGQPRNTVPFQRLFELLARATAEPCVFLFERMKMHLQAFLAVGDLGEDAAAVLRSVIKNSGRLLGTAAATSEACSEALLYILAAE